MASLPHQITVTDRTGNAHPVIAAKRLDSFRVLVVREWHGSMPFVCHTFNEQDGGFHHGHYCETLERAMEVFNAKAVQQVTDALSVAHAALCVLTLTPGLLAHLEQTDPMALRQAREAIELARPLLPNA